MFNLVIVDDEAIVANGLAKFVAWKEIGFKVVGVANSGEEALAIIKKEKVHILLTDIIMGSKNGIELIEEAMLINNEIKAVILSGHEEFEYAKSAIKLGVYDYLVKPVDFDELEMLFKELYKKLEQNSEKVITATEQDKQDLNRPVSNEEKSEGMIINTVKDYIHENYSKNITLNQLAERVYIHPTYLSILFKKKTGENFTDYLTKVRINKAKEFLEDISLRIGDVSYKAGYESPKHFSKMFKELIGMTPKDYRNQL